MVHQWKPIVSEKNLQQGLDLEHLIVIECSHFGRWEVKDQSPIFPGPTVLLRSPQAEGRARTLLPVNLFIILSFEFRRLPADFFSTCWCFWCIWSGCVSPSSYSCSSKFSYDWINSLFWQINLKAVKNREFVLTVLVIRRSSAISSRLQTAQTRLKSDMMQCIDTRPKGGASTSASRRCTLFVINKIIYLFINR